MVRDHREHEQWTKRGEVVRGGQIQERWSRMVRNGQKPDRWSERKGELGRVKGVERGHQRKGRQGC